MAKHPQKVHPAAHHVQKMKAAMHKHHQDMSQLMDQLQGALGQGPQQQDQQQPPGGQVPPQMGGPAGPGMAAADGSSPLGGKAV